MNKNVPEIRFKGFINDWEQRKLSEMKDPNDKYSFTGGPFGSDLKSSDYTETGVRIIQLQNIGDGFFNDGYKIYTSEKKANSLHSNLIYPNEIIIAKMADPLARAAIMPCLESIYLMASDGIRLKVDSRKYDNYFVLTLINSVPFRKKALDNSSGTTRKRIGLNTLGDLISYVPLKEEQTEIGNFFKQLDDTIALHQEKLVALKKIKTALLDKIFKQEVRFSGFKETWEERKLGNVAEDTYGGGTPKTQISKYWEGDIPWIQSSDIQLDAVSKVIPKKFISGDAIINSAAKIIPENSIAIVTRVGVGKLAFMPYSYSTSQDFLSLSKLTVSSWFAVYSIYNLIKKEINNIQGTSIKGITKADLLDKQFRVPRQKVEQSMIGNLFKQLDDTIVLHRQKIDSLHKLKRAYLQKMFL